MISLESFNISLDAVAICVFAILFSSLWADKARLPLHVDFRWATGLSIFYCVIDILFNRFDLDPANNTTLWILSMLGFVVEYAITVLFSLYLFRLAALDERLYHGAYLGYTVGAAVFSLALFVLALCGYCFEVREGVYYRTTLWPFVLLFPFLCLLSNCFVLLISRATQHIRVTFAGLCLLPPVGILISYENPNVSAVSILLLLISIVLYVNIYVRQAQELRASAAELKSAQTEALVSQIQPHFLYNCISTCVALCRVAPNAAAEMMTNFGKYLRVNLDAIRKREPVTFDEELQHIKVYLSLEKYRLDDKLSVVYNIGESEFLVPALSIQPLVENAVKHGLAEPGLTGTVTISTWEENGACYVEVKDDGAGFDPSAPQASDRSHVGLGNVQKRLEMLVGGTMTVSSAVGQGTVVTVRIPREKEKGETA